MGDHTHKGCGGCSHEVEHELEEGYEEGIRTGDAPMAACCERDLTERREANRIMDILQKADVSTARQKHQQEVIVSKPTRASANDSDSDDFSEDFERYRRQRLAEVKREQARVRQVTRMKNTAFQELLQRSRSSKKKIVCHFSIAGNNFSQHLDEYLDELVLDITKFDLVCVENTKGTVINSKEAVKQPALCYFEGSSVVSVLFAEEMGGPEEVDEKCIQRWLRQCHLLDEHHHAHKGDHRNSDSEEEEPCEICGRTYPHEHIAAVGALQLSSEDESNDDFDDI